ncbi:MAG: MBL fold metallo-hydrolase [Cohaesibacter sp.]|jgi:glyoxylase-like metal-dependent hydrolase (beta-lactamase superfamily II)|nr:MBL fold metallo-hydrolase [Cohaesibacter sp.]
MRKTVNSPLLGSLDSALINRRDLLKQGGILAAGLALGTATPSWAKTSFSLGTIKVDTLSDGHLTLPGDMAFGHLPQDELAPILELYSQDRKRVTPECNVTLVRDGDRNILFDVGSGPNFMPTAGKILDALDETGLSTEDITHVVFTHAHPDHLWGLLDDFDDPLFPNAEHLIGKTEWDYWMDPTTVDKIGASRQSFAVGAKNRLTAIEDAISFFKDGEEILPGIAAHASFGHTPGHMSFEIRNGSNAAMVIGDAIGNHHVAFERPDWVSASDQDPQMGADSRLRLLDKIATENMQLIGFHLPGGGIGRCERKNNTYQFISEAS